MNVDQWLPVAHRKARSLSATSHAQRKVLLQIPIAVLLTNSLLDPRGFIHRVL